ncbi:carboxypeptidase-like regulatory domain-containing protein [bacterium]|nr:carboxypeptidase-like regulatory domain-containing protein [bacterium]
MIMLKGTHYLGGSDSSGRYEILDVPFGSYWAECWHPEGQGVMLMVHVYSDIVQLDISLIPPLPPQGSCWEPEVKYAGSVLDLQTRKPIVGAILHSLYDYRGCNFPVAWTDENGHFDCKWGYGPDSVLVWARGYEPLFTVAGIEPPDPGLLVHSLDFSLSPVAEIAAEEEKESPRFLPDGKPLYASLRGGPMARPTLPNPFGLLRIRVVDGWRDNQPLPFAYVWIFELEQGARTDANGEFICGPLEPGRYTVRAMKSAYNPCPEGGRVEVEVTPYMDSSLQYTTDIEICMYEQP